MMDLFLSSSPRQIFLILTLITILPRATEQAAWPAGTQAHASSTHKPDGPGGSGYDAGNAIDTDEASYWNDDTVGAFPDALRIVPPGPVGLLGITMLSTSGGFITAYYIEGLFSNHTWTTLARLSNVSETTSTAIFPELCTVSQLRIGVENATAAPRPQFSRINELYPLYSSDALRMNDSSSNPNTSLSPSSTMNSAPSNGSTSNQMPTSSHGGKESFLYRFLADFAGSFVGFMAGIIIAALGYVWFRRRRRQTSSLNQEARELDAPGSRPTEIYEAAEEPPRIELRSSPSPASRNPST